MTIRCVWSGDDPAMIAYHDDEWGVPIVDERGLFACLTLEAAQAGLSWATILARRGGYRAVFHDWDLARIAAATDDERERWYVDARIVRHRKKIDDTVNNARATLALAAGGTSLSEIVWRYAQPSARRVSMADVPAETTQSRALSRELRRRGFRFVGPKIAYAFMQAAGIVNDHQIDCFGHDAVERLRADILPERT